MIADLEMPAPNTMGETFDILAQAGILSDETARRMKKAVGFRNIAVHNYQAIDWEIVHAVARHHSHDFTVFAQAVAAAIAK